MLEALVVVMVVPVTVSLLAAGIFAIRKRTANAIAEVQDREEGDVEIDRLRPNGN